MQWFQRQRFQNQQVQRATQKIGSFRTHLCLLSEYDMSTAPAIPAYSDMHVGPELTVVALPALKLSVSDSETVRYEVPRIP
jgi:hypothetical protein